MTSPIVLEWAYRLTRAAHAPWVAKRVRAIDAEWPSAPTDMRRSMWTLGSPWACR